MSHANDRFSLRCGICWLGALLAINLVALAQTSAPTSPPEQAPTSVAGTNTGTGADLQAAPGNGEVIADDVYVRSGPSANHYTISKLAKGARVRIVQESGEWCEIAAPAGTFSLISSDYVDTSDDKTGVINGNNVRVRAGSSLNDNKYTVQTLLSKGTPVTILGRNADGFLRIAPPEGATVWINKSYVRRVEGAEPVPVATADTSAPPSTAGSTTSIKTTETQRDSGDKTAGSRKSPADTKLAGDSIPKSASTSLEQMRTLQILDSEVRTELDKPVFERKLQPFYHRYRAIEDNPADEVNRKYAKVRLEQLQGMMTVLDTVGNLQGLNEVAEQKRRQFLETRAGLSQPAADPAEALVDAYGELRVSALYPRGSVPQRFRLVDSRGANERTVGYVEVPEGLNIDIDRYLGSYVGVRAATKRWQEGGVNPVPIFILGEIMLAERPPAITADGQASLSP